MNMDNKTYARYVEARAPHSPLARDCTRAFLVGGGICFAAEGLIQLIGWLGSLPRDAAAAWVSILLVLSAVVLTAVGVFDKIARYAGAGTLLPITGFANAVASPAIDSRAEGFVLGVGAKIFTVAGPVLLYGTAAGAIYGVIYWLMTVIF